MHFQETNVHSGEGQETTSAQTPTFGSNITSPPDHAGRQRCGAGQHPAAAGVNPTHEGPDPPVPCKYQIDDLDTEIDPLHIRIVQKEFISEMAALVKNS